MHARICFALYMTLTYATDKFIK